MSKMISRKIRRRGFDADEIKRRRKRLPYQAVNSEIRRELLTFVSDQGFSIKDAAIRLNINYSTAKTILQLYRRTGRIDKIENSKLPIDGELDDDEFNFNEESSTEDFENQSPKSPDSFQIMDPQL